MSEPQNEVEAAGGRSDSTAELGRVTKFDHPDLVGGIVWADCELRWINKRIAQAVLDEREACAEICDDRAWGVGGPAKSCADAIRERSNVKVTGDGRLHRPRPC